MASHPSDAGEARPAINVRHHEGFSAVPTHIGEIDRFGQVTRGVDKKKIEALSSPMEILSLSKPYFLMEEHECCSRLIHCRFNLDR